VKIAVTATEPGLDAPVDSRFGRCLHFVFVDTETMDVETVANENVTAAGGAGPQAAQTVADKGAKAVLTGNCGPNAHRALQAAGVQVVVGVSGTVKEVAEKFKAGEYATAESPNVDAKYGT
jgi:predicted Fe-Mo cluster-binding NifX family protein